ncbi:ubiquitin-like-specific protease 1D [Musa acuminata AAA Group]|uniref:ubiquitin-like-specific protease 1D n=1 Tax=Musa acuminata AAA Group TaxID=214697 RepID=UPI0031D83921
MAKERLQIDWKEMLAGRDDGPPPEVEVVAAASGHGEAGPADASELVQFSDHELQERIQRVVKQLSLGIGSRLNDSGAKLRASLRQMQAELDRRKLVRVPKASGRCSKVLQSENIESSGTVKDSSENSTAPKSHPQSSFTSKFLEKLQGKADAASNEDLKVISRGKSRGSEKNELQKDERQHQIATASQSARLSSRQTHFQCASSIAKKDQHMSLTSKYRDLELSNLPKGKSYSNCKRRALDSEDTNYVAFKWKKVREVVLLDEEEVHTVEPMEDGCDKWKEVKVYYPSRDDPESVELSYADIKCLNPESYLSSTIMNFYIQYLQRPLAVTDRPRGDYHFFNTYFYKKLEEAVSFKVDKACFEKLRRWWKGVNIFQKSYIFIPVHGDMHWSLAVICIPAQEDESGPIVLHLDSLGFHNSQSIFHIIDRFLKEEWNYINQNSSRPDLPFSVNIWRHLSSSIEKKKITVPQQKNEYDCGLFVLYFMERFIEEAPERLKRKDLAMFGSKWFHPEDASGLRKQIRDLLLEVFRCAKRENNKAGSTSSCGSSEDD